MVKNSTLHFRSDPVHFTKKLEESMHAQKADGGDWEGAYLYQILLLMYIYANKYIFLIVCSFNGFLNEFYSRAAQFGVTSCTVKSSLK
jgi:hypothetical protein